MFLLHEIGGAEKNNIDCRIKSTRFDVLSLELLKVEFRELMNPISNLDQGKEFHVQRHVFVLIRIS